MKQFEYRMHEITGLHVPGISLELNELGREGWQVTQYFPPSQALGESAAVLLMREQTANVEPKKYRE